jgi:hypothetical protein
MRTYTDPNERRFHLDPEFHAQVVEVGLLLQAPPYEMARELAERAAIEAVTVVSPLSVWEEREEEQRRRVASVRLGGERVSRPSMDWRPPEANSTPGDHRLFPRVPDGDWYCTGCVWAFGYRVGATRARDVWWTDSRHKLDLSRLAP